MAKKLAVFELRWDSRHQNWCLYRGAVLIQELWHEKKYAIRLAATEVRARSFIWISPCKLLIKTKKGRITKGGDGERSYGADSRRRKG